ncbi:MAG: hypothetical protein ACYCU7_03220 [Acidimicrobiales bacterium]
MTTPDLAMVIDRFQRTMWLPDPGIVYLTLATVAANRLPGDPTWLLIVGPPSSGKSEALDALSELREVHSVSTFSEAGLLSGSPARNGSGATGGLLRQLGERGLIVASDFSTLLNEHGSTRNRLFACLREVYDGKFVRRLGTEGGRSFAWAGHAGFVGAVTEAIDAPNIDLGLLGERFVYYRVPTVSADDEYMACVVADENAGRQAEIRRDRAAVIREFFDGLDLPDVLAPLTEDEQERLITLANIGARCRSSVVRDGHSREIEFVPGHERSPRLFAQLRQLHAGLSVIGTPPAVLWTLLGKAALDGVHSGRRKVLDYLVANPGAHTTATVAGHCSETPTPTRRHLQDLTAHGVVDLVGEFPERWAASRWLRERWWAVGDVGGSKASDPKPGDEAW